MNTSNLDSSRAALEHVGAEAALTGAVLFAAALAFVPVTMALYDRLVPKAEPAPPLWKLRQGFLALTGLVGLLLALSKLPSDTPETLLRAMLLSGLVTLGVAAAIVFPLRPLGLSVRTALGLGKAAHLRALGAGIFAYALTLPGIDGLNLVNPWLWQRLGLELPESDLRDLLLSLEPHKLGLLVFLFVFILPFFEELIFRGYLQPVLSERFGVRRGILLTAICFASLHQNSALPILAFALLLGGIRAHSGSVWASSGVHALHNAIQLVALLALESQGSAGTILPPWLFLGARN